ncbi:hypothetical protein C1H46_016851 [Malus baccata]|uniref:Uncharacterized protein n=1 Tax=Malus baccata TaxID=106549 RepID=A0A540MFK6_MALBA|nr:hypothetical protein C1H46_016851 [Malus baccata]
MPSLDARLTAHMNSPDVVDCGVHSSLPNLSATIADNHEIRSFPVSLVVEKC